jgi:hypothetical protein
MKYRGLIFTLTICFLSVMAFADNPSDTQLSPSDLQTTVLQENSHANRKCYAQRQKDEASSRQAKSGTSSNNNRPRVSHKPYSSEDAEPTS